MGEEGLSAGGGEEGGGECGSALGEVMDYGIVFSGNSWNGSRREGVSYFVNGCTRFLRRGVKWLSVGFRE